VFQRESRHPHKVQLLAPARRFPISCCLLSAGQLETASIPAIVDPSLSLIPAANVVQIQATHTPSRITRSTLGWRIVVGKQVDVIRHRGPTTETAHHNHPLLPLAPPPTTLHSMTGLAPPSHLYMPLLYINTRALPKSLHKCIWDKPHHPKKQSIAVVPGLVGISNGVFYVGGYGG
jgi:hypothetical protein